MAAVGCAVLETITAPGFLDRVASRGAHLRAGLEALAIRFNLGEVRGEGLLLALSLHPHSVGPQVVAESREAGLLLNAPRPDALRFMPALTITRAEIDQMLSLLADVLARVLPTSQEPARRRA